MPPRGPGLRTKSCLALAILACLGAGAMVAGLAWAQHGKQRIAVVDFDTEALHNRWHFGWRYSNLGRAADDNLASELARTDSFRLIERPQLG